MLMNRRMFTLMASCAAPMLVAAAAKAEEASLQDIAKAMQVLPQIVIYQAKEIVTLDPAKPTVQAVAVVDDRILAAPGEALCPRRGPFPFRGEAAGTDGEESSRGAGRGPARLRPSCARGVRPSLLRPVCPPSGIALERVDGMLR